MGRQVGASDIILAAVLVPVLSLAAVQIARRLGRWIDRAIRRAFAETVSEVVAPDLARMGNRLGQSVDELRQQNAREHRVTAVRLSKIEDRLEVLESKLPGRPPSYRTRSTDKDGL